MFKNINYFTGNGLSGIWDPSGSSIVPENTKKFPGNGEIRTHAFEKTGALNQRLRPLGHVTAHSYYSEARKPF